MQSGQTTLQELNNKFDLDWNDFTTFIRNKEKIAKVEAAIKDASPKDDKEKHALGMLCYKLGSYLIHTTRNEEIALPKLLMASEILTGNELAWTQNHIAFCHQQSVADIGEEKSVDIVSIRTKARVYCNKIIKEYAEKPDIESVKITAFAYSIRGLALHDDGQLNEAVNDHVIALKLYKDHKLYDDQCARVMLRYAQILAKQNKIEEANQMFEELVQYWNGKQNGLNPYQARFNSSYGDFLLNNGLKAKALHCFKQAAKVARNLDGEESKVTQDLNAKVTELLEIINPDVPRVYSQQSGFTHFQSTQTAADVDNTNQHNQQAAVVNTGNSNMTLK